MEASTLAPAEPRRLPLPLARLSDETLARLVRRGDDAAFTMLYRRYHQPLYRYCRSILRDDGDAQDALQSTFTGALKALRRDEPAAAVRPWLFRIAHNESVSVLRRRRPASELPEQMAGGEPPLEERAAQRERLTQLMSDLRELPDRQRSALIMRELSDLSHEEIAVALETTTGTAKQAIFEARRSLAELEAGRTTPCADICRIVSDGDRRALRGKRVRGHLRSCRECAAFAAAIDTRSAELRALTPALPAAAAASLLAHVLGGGGSAGAGGAAAGAGGAAAGAGSGGAAGGGSAAAGAAGKAAIGFGLLKPAASATLLAAAAVGTADVVVHHHGRRAEQRLAPAQVPGTSSVPGPLAAVSDGPVFVPVSESAGGGAGRFATALRGGDLTAAPDSGTQGQPVVLWRGSHRRRHGSGAVGSRGAAGRTAAGNGFAATHATGRSSSTYASDTAPAGRGRRDAARGRGDSSTPHPSHGSTVAHASPPPQPPAAGHSRPAAGSHVPAANAGIPAANLGTGRRSSSRLTIKPGALRVGALSPAGGAVAAPAPSHQSHATGRSGSSGSGVSRTAPRSR